MQCKFLPQIRCAEVTPHPFKYPSFVLVSLQEMHLINLDRLFPSRHHQDEWVAHLHQHSLHLLHALNNSPIVMCKHRKIPTTEYYEELCLFFIIYCIHSHICVQFGLLQYFYNLIYVCTFNYATMHIAYS